MRVLRSPPAGTPPHRASWPGTGDTRGAHTGGGVSLTCFQILLLLLQLGLQRGQLLTGAAPLRRRKAQPFSRLCLLHSPASCPPEHLGRPPLPPPPASPLTPTPRWPLQQVPVFWVQSLASLLSAVPAWETGPHPPLCPALTPSPLPCRKGSHSRNGGWAFSPPGFADSVPFTWHQPPWFSPA